MKKITMLSFLMLLFTATLMAQTYNISDAIFYDSSCDPSQTVLATDPFNFEIGFDATMQNQNLSHQFTRRVEAVFRDANGNVVKTVNLGSNNIVDATYDLYETHLAGLPDGEIRVSFVITYKHIINNPYNNPLSVTDNGSSACSINFTNTSQTLVCTVEDALCFNFNNCDDVTVGLYEKLGYMRSNVSPAGGNYAYQWYIFPDNGPYYPAGTSDRVQLISGCANYSLTVTDLDTGCKYRAEKTGCSIEIELPCLIGTPTGLAWVGQTQLGGYVLDWNDTPGASHYSVHVTQNDPACCPTGPNGPITNVYSNITSSQFVYTPKAAKGTCFSWKVIAHCPSGVGSSTSQPSCIQGLKSNESADTRGTIANSEILIYPNPATDAVNVEVKGIDADFADVTILDSHGKVIMKTEVSTEESRLQFSWNIPSELSAGVYFVQIKDQDKVITKKFMHLK